MAEQQSAAKPAGSILPPAVRARPAKKANVRGKRGRSKAGWFTGLLSGLLFSLFAAAILGGLIWLNIADLRTILATSLKLDESEYTYLEARKSELAQAEADLKARARQLDSSMAAVDKQQKELARTKTELDARAEELNARAASLSGQQINLDALASLYESMEPEKAARILTAGESLEGQIPVLRNMDKSCLALILAEMTPAQASKIVMLIAGNLAANP